MVSACRHVSHVVSVEGASLKHLRQIESMVGLGKILRVFQVLFLLLSFVHGVNADQNTKAPRVSKDGALLLRGRMQLRGADVSMPLQSALCLRGRMRRVEKARGQGIHCRFPSVARAKVAKLLHGTFQNIPSHTKLRLHVILLLRSNFAPYSFAEQVSLFLLWHLRQHIHIVTSLVA